MHDTLVTGGLNQAKLSKEDEERLEPNRKRNPDYIGEAIREYAFPDLGPHIVQKTFHIESPVTRGMDITFERYYPVEKLLVQSFARRRVYERDSATEDKAFKEDILRYETFARDNGYKFLPIIDGNIEREDLARIVPVKPKQKKATNDVA